MRINDRPTFRHDGIMALQLQHQEHLGRISGLLELPHQQAVDREREKAGRDPLLEKAIADFKNAFDNANPEAVAEMGRELRERGSSAQQQMQQRVNPRYPQPTQSRLLC